jgi:hypothetical protein
VVLEPLEEILVEVDPVKSSQQSLSLLIIAGWTYNAAAEVRQAYAFGRIRTFREPELVGGSYQCS